MSKGLSGRVVLSCVFLTAGTLGDCTVQSESPPNQKFDAAALKLVAKFRLNPQRQPELIGRRGAQPVEFRLG